MRYSFNLVDERWVPCLWRDGTAEELSLRQTLTRAHDVREVQGDTPLETVALCRLLLAILHRNFETRTAAQWRKLHEVGRFEAARLEAYLDTWAERFDLFHVERPFYQADDKRAQYKSVISLVPQMASGNNAALFDHHSEQEGATLTPAQAARAVLTAQAFGYGGLSGMEEKFTDAPCAKGVIFMALGDTLFETLLFNLVRYYDRDPIPSDEDDSPTWEMKDAFKRRRLPKGYLDYLTWQNRRILLLPEEGPNGETVVRRMKWAPGLRLEGEELDPMKRYAWEKDKKQPVRVLQFSADRALWRDCDTLFVMNAPDHIKPPAAFRHLHNLVEAGILALDKTLRFEALGMAKDQAKLEYFRAETFPLPLEYLKREEAVTELRTALQIAESVADLLRWAVFMLGRRTLKPEADEGKPLSKEERQAVNNFTEPWGAETRFWGGLEAPFQRLLRGLPHNRDRDAGEWRAALRRAAQQAFAQATRYTGEDARARKAVVTAEGMLRLGLDRVVPQETIKEGGYA